MNEYAFIEFILASALLLLGLSLCFTSVPLVAIFPFCGCIFVFYLGIECLD